MAVLGTSCSTSLWRVEARLVRQCAVASTSLSPTLSQGRLTAPLSLRRRVSGPGQLRPLKHAQQAAVRASADNQVDVKNETPLPPPSVGPASRLSAASSKDSNRSSGGSDKNNGLFTTMLSVALAGCGLTAYLSYSKLAGHEVFCPVGGCNTVLNSPYATVLGLPLPLYGFSAYASVAAMATMLRKQAGDEGGHVPASWSPKLLLFGLTSLMACISGFLMTILATQLHEQCAYCTTSALFSVSLFAMSLKSLSSQELKKALVPDVAVCASTLLALSLLVSAQPDPAQASSKIESPSFIPYYPTEVTTPSPPNAVSLAKHLRDVGAKMYGAFWCSHCAEQKEDFGAEALEVLPYVECYPDGWSRGRDMAKPCIDAKIDGFPIWKINGQTLEGEQTLAALAKASKYKGP